MRFCPNCSAMQRDDKAKICRKCGHSLEDGNADEAKDLVMSEREELLSVIGGSHEYDKERPCPICHEPTRQIHREIERMVLGDRVPIKGLRLMGGDLTKRAETLINLDVIGRECRGGHTLCEQYRVRERQLCPLCRRPMITYGSTLMSCRDCSLHFPRDIFSSEDPEKILTSEGFSRVGKRSV